MTKAYSLGSLPLGGLAALSTPRYAMTDSPSPDSLRPGNLVGPWRVEGYAGRGSYGLVFRARFASRPHSPLVALKLVAFPADPRFLREAALLARLSHRAVPRLVAQGDWHASSEAVHPYLVMELIVTQKVTRR